jgi:hypothetical protein
MEKVTMGTKCRLPLDGACRPVVMDGTSAPGDGISS